MHRLIPIGQKELNGKVENTHKQDDREFYSFGEAKTFESLEKQMRSYNERWNRQRATKALGWKTPEQAIELAYVCAVVMVAIQCPKPRAAVLDIPQPAPRKKAKAKRTTQADRYLQWLDWDEKKSQNAFLALPVMSQSSSLGTQQLA